MSFSISLIFLSTLRNLFPEENHILPRNYCEKEEKANESMKILKKGTRNIVVYISRLQIVLVVITVVHTFMYVYNGKITRINLGVGTWKTSACIGSTPKFSHTILDSFTFWISLS